jgi:hypothetical protein
MRVRSKLLVFADNPAKWTSERDNRSLFGFPLTIRSISRLMGKRDTPPCICNVNFERYYFDHNHFSACEKRHHDFGVMFSGTITATRVNFKK